MFKHVINTRSHDDANTIIHIHKGALPLTSILFSQQRIHRQLDFWSFTNYFIVSCVFGASFGRIYMLFIRKRKEDTFNRFCDWQKRPANLVEDENLRIEEKGLTKRLWSDVVNERKYVLYVYQLLTVMVSWGIQISNRKLLSCI